MEAAWLLRVICSCASLHLLSSYLLQMRLKPHCDSISVLCWCIHSGQAETLLVHHVSVVYSMNVFLFVSFIFQSVASSLH